MKILKASAGSGKTYRLSKTYRDILLESDDRFAYRHILAVTFTNKATAEMKARILKDLARESETNPKAKRILTDILHDYSAFAISTIDKFFQRALKSFSREIGHFSSYQIELDRAGVIAEAMDRILDSLTEEDKQILQWIRFTVSDTLENGSKVKIEERLYEMGGLLKNEEHRMLLEETGLRDRDLFSKERLETLRKECRRIISGFEASCKSFGIEAEKGKPVKIPGVRAMKADECLKELFDRGYDLYNTAFTIDKLIFSLGLAGEFYERFEEILKEKNLMCLDESNTILKDIINGSDAPFVYEKLGVRFRDFLLDEFQDTSGIQWENFLPLLRESEGGDENGPATNLIVGDVKQSIYRWRNSDWRLLGEKVKQEFPLAQEEPMQDNWRSCRSIVDFNNRFFAYVAPMVGAGDMYADVRQTPRTDDPQAGHVRVSFTDNQEEAALESLRSVLEHGARLSDIAVLVRGNEEGKAMADALVAAGFPVISNDSLSLKSSMTLRRLVSLLNCIDKPGDAVSTYLGSSLGVEFPQSYTSLPDLCEGLLRELMKSDPESVRKESMYVQAFEDLLLDYSVQNGNDLRGFLSHWAEGNFFLSSPDSQDAVTIITVHKSKGLQFPHVIFPYAHKVIRYRAGVHWCRLSDEKAPTLSGIYPVELTSSMERSLFASDLAREREMQDIDNLNIFYVALTRAEKSLHIIAREPSKKCRDSINAGKPQFSNYSEALFAFCQGSVESTFGEAYDFKQMEREESDMAEPWPVDYNSVALDGRLTPSKDAFDFFGEDGTTGVEASGRLMGVALHDILSAVTVPSDLEKAVKTSRLDGSLNDVQAAGAYELLKKRIASHPEWFNGGGRNEVSIIDGCGNLHRPDRVVETADGTIVIDYKFGVKKESYARQVGRYIRLYEKMGFKNVRGYIWYVPSDEVEPVTSSYTHQE